METSRPGPIVRIEDLQVTVRTARGPLPVIDRATLALHADEAVGIVGESGSGKTMLCRSLIGTLPRHGARVTGGRLRFRDQDLTHASEREWRRVRGREIGYVPQSALAGLNPVLTIETQLVEALAPGQGLWRRLSRREAAKEAAALLDLVRIPRAALVLRQRAAQLSGGMRQRVMLAAALARRPAVLVADEPTTSLDVTIQAEILALIDRLRRELRMALVIVSHDLAVIEASCDRVMVMYAGASCEAGPLPGVTRAPRHPYTRALRGSRVDAADRDRPLDAIPGEPPSIGRWPDGCRFAPRCSMADAACTQGPHPLLRPVGVSIDAWSSACLHAERLEDRA